MVPVSSRNRKPIRPRRPAELAGRFRETQTVSETTTESVFRLGAACELAIVTFYLYYLLLALGRAQIGKNHWHNEGPLWALHALVLALALWMLWKQYSPRKPRLSPPRQPTTEAPT